MASLIASQNLALEPSWVSELERELRSSDVSRSKEVGKETVFSALRSHGINVTPLISNKLLKDYGFGNIIQYDRLIHDLKIQVEHAQKKAREEECLKGHVKVFAKGETAPIVQQRVGIRMKIVEDVSEEEEEEEPLVDSDVALKEFRELFKKWALERYKIDNPDTEMEDIDPEVMDKYARLFFAVVAEEVVKKQKGSDTGRTLDEINTSIPDWPTMLVSYQAFKKVCLKLLDKPEHLAQLFSEAALPGKTVHTTMTYQQFSLMSIGLTKAALVRMIDAFIGAPGLSSTNANNPNTKGSLFNMFNTWKDSKLGFVSGKSLFDGMKNSIPTEPDETIMEFVKQCLGKDAKKENFDAEPAQFSRFAALLRNEGNIEEDAVEEDKLEGETDSDLMRSVREAILEASNYNPDKVYDLLVFTAVNNPPYESDKLTIDAVIRAISNGLDVKLSARQQAVIARILHEHIQDEGELISVNSFLKEFDILPRGAPTSIPPSAATNDHCGRFGHQEYNESEILTPIIPRPNTSGPQSKSTLSEGVTLSLDMENPYIPEVSKEPVASTGVGDAIKLGPSQERVPPPRTQNELAAAIEAGYEMSEATKKDILANAARAEEKRRAQGLNNDLYRSELPPPSRNRGRGNTSSNIAATLNWSI